MQSKITAGEVALTLDGEEVFLRPTLAAATRISNNFGGFGKAIDAVIARDLGAATYVIRWGLNLSDRDARDLGEKVWRTGFYEGGVTVPLLNYLAILQNGGRPLPDQPEDKPDDGSAEGNV